MLIFVKWLIHEQNNYVIDSHGTSGLSHGKLNHFKYLEILCNRELDH